MENAAGKYLQGSLEAHQLTTLLRKKIAMALQSKCVVDQVRRFCNSHALPYCMRRKVKLETEEGMLLFPT